MIENKLGLFTQRKTEQHEDSDVVNIHPFSTSFSNYAVQGQGITGNRTPFTDQRLQILEGTTLSTFQVLTFILGVN